MRRDLSAVGLFANPSASEVWRLLKEYFELEGEHADQTGFKEFVVFRIKPLGGGLSFCGEKLIDRLFEKWLLDEHLTKQCQHLMLSDAL